MKRRAESVKVQAAAKINLLLDIVHKRTDGYHDLFMVMQSVSVYDTVTVTRGQEQGVTLTCSEPSLPVDEHNIAYKAALAFFKLAKVKNTGIRIHIEKQIPFAAGLAGGSADGAAVLTALNALYRTGLSQEALCRIGVSVGADIPFCICGGTMLAQGIGNVLYPLKPLKRCYIVLAKPEQGVNTAKAYAEYDRAGRQWEPDKLGMLMAVENRDMDGICQRLANVFEQFIEVPDRVMIRQVMTAHGARGVCMSGSGPTVFGIFYEKEQAEACAAELSSRINDVCVCQPVKEGCRFVSKKEV